MDLKCVMCMNCKYSIREIAVLLIEKYLLLIRFRIDPKIIYRERKKR
jgi:hypothetical protein